MADQQGVIRKLAAILYADVAGYSRLTGADEEGTHRTVADYLDAISGLVSGHSGRVVHYAGDAVLADFPSVVTAVKCAIDIQKDLATRNADIPDDRKVQFRIGVNLGDVIVIGVNLGDVIVDRDDIYGNGVNVAARLESLADVGGICISQKVLDEVEGKIDIDFEDMGPQEVKNIAEPIRAYRTIIGKPSVVTSPVHPDSKPSIAVLPFDILGNNPQASDLVEGLTEDLITALAKVRELFVIDRHSVESYKGRSAMVRDVASALGVRYVLTGSIRAIGDRLRCSVQLVDSVDGQHLWAERYDRQIDDIFALQDEIVWHILLELQVTLTDGESARIASRGTRNLEAWLLRVQGANELAKMTPHGIIRARQLFEGARTADPQWARPLAGIAHCYYYEARFGWGLPRQDSIARGIDYAEQAIAMDPEESFGYQALRGLNLLLGKHDEALTFAKKAVELAPNDQLANGALAATRMFREEFAAAIETFERVMRLGPSVNRMFRRGFGLTLLCAHQTDRAVLILEKLARQEPEWTEGLVQLAATYASVGRLEEASSTVEKILSCDPTYTTSRYLGLLQFKSPKRNEWIRELLIKAGLPE